MYNNLNISIIAAIAKNNVIGYKNKIPWYLPNDLLWFKKNTVHKTIIMGRFTWESIQRIPLKNRKNIVVTRNKNKYSKIKEFLWTSSLNEAIKNADSDKEIMIIGGASLYQQSLSYVSRMYLTYIDFLPKGNVYFPRYQKNQWKIIFLKYNNSNTVNLYNHKFLIIEKNHN